MGEIKNPACFCRTVKQLSAPSLSAADDAAFSHHLAKNTRYQLTASAEISASVGQIGARCW